MPHLMKIQRWRNQDVRLRRRALPQVMLRPESMGQSHPRQTLFKASLGFSF